MKKLIIPLSLPVLLLGPLALAADSYRVSGPQGTSVFQVTFFNQGEAPETHPDVDPITASTWTLDNLQKTKVLNSIDYWAEVITPRTGQLPALIHITTFDDENAVGSSEFVHQGQFSLTELQAALLGQDPGSLPLGSHAQLTLGKMDYDTLAYVPSLLPRSTTQADTFSIALHEMAHGLGINSNIAGQNSLIDQNDQEDEQSDETDEEETIADNVPDTPASNTSDTPSLPTPDTANTPTPSDSKPYASTTYGSWAEHLRDDNGRPLLPGQAVLCSSCDNAYSDNAFDVRQDKGYFAGQYVNEVLAGAMPGVPIKIMGEDGKLDTDYLSHIELKNSLMSHQNYRNYTTFMEAEMAVLQDMGYQIERRNFFGFSVYGDNQTIINQHGYSLWDTASQAYIANQYNTSTLGLGLHIYGSHNQLHQAADILTSGAGAAGIRVDGENNTLIIEPNTRVYADGLNGRGVMFTYGKDHNLIHQGDIQANGEKGIAALFDFGNNLLGNSTEYRGSFIHSIDDKEADLLPELEGALVNNADISGRLSGKDAAIYISPNALVNNINIMNGARLEGDIYSDYDQKDDNGQQRLTQLTFGKLADNRGRASNEADASFNLRYDGNIDGINNLALNLSGGQTSLNGTHQVYSVNVASGAKLGGNSQYTLNNNGLFSNHGIIAPGNSMGRIDIQGNYQQGQNGQLLLEISSDGSSDIFTVSGTADLNGQLTFAPQVGWYPSGWTQDTHDMLVFGSTTGEFSEANSQFESSTLRLQITPQGNGLYQLTMLRDNNAYSQYALDDNARRAGRALDQIVANAQADLQPLFSSLDFANSDAIANTLSQLSPANYSAMFASSLNREQQITDIISTRNTSASDRSEPGPRAFAIPFGGGFWQNRQDNSVGYNASSYGIIFGAEKPSETEPDWTFGFHGAVSGQTVKVKSPENGTGKTTAFNLGLHTRYAQDPMSGIYLFGNGRIGIEDGSMDHSVRIGNYHTNNQSDWTGLSGSLMAGGGYNWALTSELSAGPVAALNYTVLSRPSISENGCGSACLELDSQTFNSLRSSIGVGSTLDLSKATGQGVKAGLRLIWNHEYLDTDLVQNANFSGYDNVSFSSKNRITGRDSLGVQGDLGYQINKNVTVSIGASSDLFRSGYSSISGNASVNWRF
ncbi:autotransporter outer membrane beta-barrel domain-containing protein [Limnobaculum parvum]|uniref:Autotransporter outer membrane beta-barrel domain-containing protein n=2 Tax=Limnobaculum parvum TaxID=2172103 RepID=A0A2Y9TZT2_9GAMM|nr:autotransporter outer membrane beta-barrel domain-containing protein [Limnobaculum parvum]AWH89205.1 autotransporter outer membrane beta-barrel domain-containing protein [Limnobaculum parvum]